MLYSFGQPFMNKITWQRVKQQRNSKQWPACGKSKLSTAE